MKPSSHYKTHSTAVYYNNGQVFTNSTDSNTHILNYHINNKDICHWSHKHCLFILQSCP